MINVNARRPAGRAATSLLVSLFVVSACVTTIWLNSQQIGSTDSSHQLIVYCAAGVRPAIEAALADYEAKLDVKTALHLGPSGALEAQAKLSERGDLFIPAAEDPFIRRMQQAGKLQEVLPLATMRLVIAAPPETDPPSSVTELLEGKRPFGLCNPQAAAGEHTQQALEAARLWQEASAAATATFPTVTELAEAIRDGGRLRSGLIWNTTAQQFNLAFNDAPELAQTESTISVGVLSSTSDHDAALRLAQYLAAPDGGRLHFVKYHYKPYLGR